MADLIGDGRIRALLKESEQHLASGEFADAIICACEAFSIFEGRIGDRAQYQIRERDSSFWSGTEISWKHMERTLGIAKNSVTIGKLDASALIRLFSQHAEEQ